MNTLDAIVRSGTAQSPYREVQWFSSISASLLCHVSVAVAAINLGFIAGPESMPLRSDRSSIALLASFSNSTDPEDQDVPQDVVETRPGEQTTAPEETNPVSETTRYTPPAMNESELAAQTPENLLQPDLFPLIRRAAEVKEFLDAEPQLAELAPPPLPRAEIDPELRFEEVEASRSSRISPAADARLGADADLLPAPIYNPPPAYPSRALLGRITGRVVLAVRVGADGNVLEAAVNESSKVEELDAAALTAVRKWRFRPASIGGVAIEWTIAVPVRFVIPGS